MRSNSIAVYNVRTRLPCDVHLVGHCEILLSYRPEELQGALVAGSASQPAFIKPLRVLPAGHRTPPAMAPALSDQDASLVRLYMTACFNQWEKLAPIARQFYDLGGSVAELRGCVRHLIV